MKIHSKRHRNAHGHFYELGKYLHGFHGHTISLVAIIIMAANQNPMIL